MSTSLLRTVYNEKTKLKRLWTETVKVYISVSLIFIIIIIMNFIDCLTPCHLKSQSFTPALLTLLSVTRCTIRLARDSECTREPRNNRQYGSCQCSFRTSSIEQASSIDLQSCKRKLTQLRSSITTRCRYTCPGTHIYSCTGTALIFNLQHIFVSIMLDQNQRKKKSS